MEGEQRGLDRRRGDGGDASTGTSMSTIIESTNTEWTDEKHSLYLNSIEETFVDQLYSHDYHLNATHNFLSKIPKELRASGSSANNLCSGQFKVQRRGHWEQLQFARAQRQRGNEIEACMLSANPWIKHFRSPNISNGSCHMGCQRNENPSYGATSSSKQLPSCSRNVYHQESLGSNTEVSDQNFTDDWEGVKKKSRTCRKKRLNNAGSDVSGKDQIVPYSHKI